MHPSDPSETRLRSALDRLRRALKERGEPNPSGHSRNLLAHFLDLAETRPFSHPDQELTPEQRVRFEELVGRVEQGEPVAYLAGETEFMGLTFTVDHRVMIPRPETEVLVKWALDLLPDGDKARVLDIGTGSGAIGLSTARLDSSTEVWLSDANSEALEVCRINAEKLGVSGRVELVEWDLFTEPPSTLPGQFELVLSNPPYVTRENSEMLEESVRKFEPAPALFGSSEHTAMEYFSRLADLAELLLIDGGSLLMETAADQAETVSRMLAARDSPRFDSIEVRADTRGIDRVVGGIGLARSDT